MKSSKATIYRAVRGEFNNSCLGKKRRGPKGKISSKMGAYLIRTLNKSPFLSVNALRHETNVEASENTVRRFLRKNGYKCRRPKRKPILNNLHKQKRFSSAMNIIKCRADLHAILVTDEKKFNLDGPDGLDQRWSRRREIHIMPEAAGWEECYGMGRRIWY